MRGGEKRNPHEGPKTWTSLKKPWECFLPAARAGGTCRVETEEEILPTLASHRKKKFYNSCERNLKCSFSAASLLMLSTDTRYSVLTELKANRKIIPPPAAGPRLKWKLWPDIGWVVVPRAAGEGKSVNERSGEGGVAAILCMYVRQKDATSSCGRLDPPKGRLTSLPPAFALQRDRVGVKECWNLLGSAAIFSFPSPQDTPSCGGKTFPDDWGGINHLLGDRKGSERREGKQLRVQNELQIWLVVCENIMHWEAAGAGKMVGVIHKNQDVRY